MPTRVVDIAGVNLSGLAAAACILFTRLRNSNFNKSSFILQEHMLIFKVMFANFINLCCTLFGEHSDILI